MESSDPKSGEQAMSPAEAEALIRGVLSPDMSHRLRSARLKEGRAILVAEAGDLNAGARVELEAAMKLAVTRIEGVSEVHIALTAERRRRRIIAVGSGKGGVGKTNIVLNLGYALQQAAMTAMLMDCDLGLANLDVLLGISPERTLHDLIQTGVDAEDVLFPIEEGFDMLPATSGIPELVEMDEDMQDIVFKKLVSLAGEYDFLMLDLGAGISNTVLTMASLTQLRIVVVTPEPTSLTDSYAMIKVLVTQHEVKDFLVIVNQATSSGEAKQTFERLAAACRNFLNIEIRNLGFIHQDMTLVESVRRQTPLLKFNPDAKASMDIKGLAQKVMRYRQDNLDRIGGRPILRDFPSD